MAPDPPPLPEPPDGGRVGWEDPPEVTPLPVSPPLSVPEPLDRGGLLDVPEPPPELPPVPPPPVAGGLLEGVGAEVPPPPVPPPPLLRGVGVVERAATKIGLPPPVGRLGGAGVEGALDLETFLGAETGLDLREAPRCRSVLEALLEPADPSAAIAPGVTGWALLGSAAAVNGR